MPLREPVPSRRSFLKAAAFAPVVGASSQLVGAEAEQSEAGATLPIAINTDSDSKPAPHFWEECAGSDRAVVGLREQWLSDLRQVHAAAGIKSVRFHGLFNDEMGVCPTNIKQINFLYVDTVFDAMLARGIKPLVELSFMPGGLASGKNTALWYRGNVTPPNDFAEWGELIGALAKHCVDRYGISEIRTWKFEVWNEPNLRYFWAGTKEQYFELYRHAAAAVKGVDPAIAVGGPQPRRPPGFPTCWISAHLSGFRSISYRLMSTPTIHKRRYSARTVAMPMKRSYLKL